VSEKRVSDRREPLKQLTTTAANRGWQNSRTCAWRAEQQQPATRLALQREGGGKTRV
jgi:hypothetical protein